MTTPSFDPQRRSVQATWLVPSALLLLCLIVYGDVLFGLRPGIISAQSGDGCGQFVYWRQLAFENLRAGKLVLWDPYVYSGLPFFGAWQAAILYPPNWIYMFVPVKTGMVLDALISTFLAGFFTSLLAAKYYAAPLPRIMSGAIVMLSGSFFAHVWPGHLTALAAMAWTPLAILAADDVVDRPRITPVAIGAFALAMQFFAGHPQTAFNTGFVIAIYAILRLFRAQRRVGIVAALIAMVIGAAALSAVQLIAGLDASQEAVRGHSGNYHFVSMYSFPPLNLLTVVAPHVFGDMKHVAYWGQWEYWEATGFIGFGALALAATGFVHGGSDRRKLWLTMAVISALIALGKYTPIFYALFKVVPGFADFRASNRFFFEATIFAALLAGSGLDYLLAGGKVGRMPIAIAAVLAAAMAAFAAAIHFDGVPIYVWVRNLGDLTYTDFSYKTVRFFNLAQHLAQQSLAIAALLGAAAAVLLACSGKRRWPAYALAALSVAELFCFARSMVTTFPVDAAYPPVLAKWRATNPGDFRVLELGYPYNSAIGLGYEGVWGYDPLVPRRYTELLTASQGGDPDTAAMYLSFDRPTSLLRVLGCREVLARIDRVERVYPVSDPAPLCYMIYRYTLETGRGPIFSRLLDPAFDATKSVVLETPPPIQPAVPHDAPAVRLRWLDTGTMEVDATTQTAGILIVNENYSRYWHAVALFGSGQQSYAIQPADYTQMAIPLSAGAHRILVRYRPDGLIAGAIVSAVSLIVLSILGFIELRKPREDRNCQ